MNQSDTKVVDAGTSAGTETDFGLKDLKATAVVYHGAKAIVDAASKFDSVEDAISALQTAWDILESQADKGGGFTPPTDAGFGSDNATVIAQSIMGLRNTVGATRKALNSMGK